MVESQILTSDPALSHEFLRAEKVVTTLLSRLRCDPIAVDPSMWSIHNWETLLWALQQQVHHGSCDDCRSLPEYVDIMAKQPQPWFSCCMTRLSTDSRLKKWELLGSMPREDAATKYIDIVNDVLPGWNEQPGPDVALLSEWSSDASAYACSNCSGGFTMLNRRHHCRRCSRLVCAPCSSNRIGLRLFPGLPQKMQRVCDECVRSMTPLVREVLEKGLELPSPSPVAAGQSTNEVAPPSPEETQPIVAQKLEVKKLIPKQALIKRGYLERMVGSRFQKRWEKFFFVLLVRKGSIGVYTHEDDMAPIEVYKLNGYTVRVKSEKRRPHQFKIEHPTQTPIRLCMTSLREMNEWIASISLAIDAANTSDTVRANES